MSANDFFNAINNQNISTPANASGLTPTINSISKGVSASSLAQTPLTPPASAPMASNANSFMNSLKSITNSVLATAPATAPNAPQVQSSNTPQTGQTGQTSNAQQQAAISNYDQLYNATKTPEQIQYQNAINQDLASAQSLNDKLGGQSQFYQDQLNQLGATDTLNQLKDTNLLIASKTAEYDNRINDVLSNPQGNEVLTQVSNRQSDYINRQKAIEVGALAAKSQALQGNYQLATEIATKATALQFEPIQQQIQNKLNFINTNRDLLSAAEKKQADKMTYVLQQQADNLAKQKEARSFALENGIDKAFYQVGGTIYRTSDGQAFSTPSEFFKAGGAQDYSNVQTVSQSNNLQKKQIVDLANKYWDAGVTISDDIATAQRKIVNNSNIYKKDVGQSVPVSGTGDVQIPATSRLAYVNNNPGNLRYVGQAGAAQGEGGFAKFATPQDGYQALINQVQLDQSRGFTVQQFVNKYAPPSENNTGLYIQQFNQALGSNNDTPINSLDTAKIAQFMALKESGTRISASSSLDPAVIKYADDLANGRIELSQVPAEGNIRNKVQAYMQQNGQQIVPKSDVKVSKEAEASFQTAISLVDKIEEQAKKVITATSLTGVTKQITQGGLPHFLAPTDVSVYKDSLDAFLSQLSRAAGEKGVLTDYDVARIKKALPGFNDTVAKRDAKLAQLKSIFEEKRNAINNIYTPTLNNQTDTTSGVTSSGISYTIIK